MAASKTVYLKADELRDLFNNEDFTGKIAKGHVSERVLREHQAPPHLGFPNGTKSQLISYIGGNGKPVAQVHQYKAPDGTLCASGLPDPKKLQVGDTLYVLKIG